MRRGRTVGEDKKQGGVREARNLVPRQVAYAALPSTLLSFRALPCAQRREGEEAHVAGNTPRCFATAQHDKGVVYAALPSFTLRTAKGRRGSSRSKPSGRPEATAFVTQDAPKNSPPSRRE